MTNQVHRDQSDTAAVEPVIFSHEATAEPVTRPDNDERAHLMHFSAHTAVGPRQQSR